jgi:hypothetical protein
MLMSAILTTQKDAPARWICGTLGRESLVTLLKRCRAQNKVPHDLKQNPLPKQNHQLRLIKGTTHVFLMDWRTPLSSM